MRSIILGTIAIACLPVAARAQSAHAVIEGECVEEAEVLKKPVNELDSYIGQCFERKKAERESCIAEWDKKRPMPKSGGPEWDAHWKQCATRWVKVVGEAKPSFDCAKANSAAARLICADAELSKLDSNLAIPFRKILGGLREIDREAAIQEQRKWINERNKKCGIGASNKAPTESLTGAKPCMVKEIKARIETFYTQYKEPISVASFDKQASKIANVPELTHERVSKQVLCGDGRQNFNLGGCGWACTPFFNRQTNVVVLDLSSVERNSLGVEANFQKFLDSVKKETEAFCEAERAAGRTSVTSRNYYVTTAEREYGPLLVYYIEGKGWEVRSNRIAMEYVEAQRQRETAEEYRRQEEFVQRQHQEQIRQAQLQKQRAAEAAQAGRETILKQIRDGSLQVASSADDKAIVEQLIRVLRSKGMQVGPSSVLCGQEFEYLGGTVAARSVDGTVGVFLINVITLFQGEVTVQPSSITAQFCGEPPGRVGPGDMFVRQWKAQFRKYDIGWQLEALL